MKQTKDQTPDYGNWVPAAMMKTLAVLIAVLLIVELLFLILLKNTILSVIGGILLVLAAAFTVYMQALPHPLRFPQRRSYGESPSVSRRPPGLGWEWNAA